MTRTFSLVLVALALSLGGCSKVKLPFMQKKNAAATPAPAPAVASTPAPAAAPPVAEAAAETAKESEPTTAEASTKGAAIVLCYHRFEERPSESLAIKPSEFEEQMQALKDQGFTVIGMQDFLAWRRGEKAISEKSCVISIDDGYRSGYDVGWPILKKFGYPFTMFIYTDFVKGQRLSGGKSLSWGELAEMRDAGVDIQSHSVSHSDLRKSPKGAVYDEWLRNELEGSKKLLEQQLGISVKAIAYPYGNHNDKVRAAALAAGYEACFSVYGQRITYHSSADQLGRYAIESGKPQVFQAAIKMSGGGGTDGASSTGQLAAASMVTQPMEGETISDPHPTLKANLATLGEIDPNSVEIRLSGIGQLPAKYDAATKTVEAPVTQKLRDKNYTVILSAKVKGRKVETRWTFNFAPEGSAAPAPTEAPLPPRATPPPKSASRR